jgi:hypothetical protein
MNNPDFWEESARLFFLAGKTAEAEQDILMAVLCRTMVSEAFRRRALAWLCRTSEAGAEGGTP